MKHENEVILEHRHWNPGSPPMVRVRDRANGCVIFEDTVENTAHWLDFFKFKWSGAAGIWKRESNSTQ